MRSSIRALLPVAALSLVLAASAGDSGATEAVSQEPGAAEASDAGAAAAPEAGEAAAAEEASEAAAAPEAGEAPAPAPTPVPEATTAASGEASAPPEAAENVAPAPRERHVVNLGPIGYDVEGRPGRVHTVARGDTLWDISDAYLGTPWVWPSIWRENQEVENPHLIYPGDRLWVTPTEIRRVTDAEAEALLAGAPGEGDPAAMDAFAMDGMGQPGEESKPPSVRLSWRDSVGLVSNEMLQGAASIVDSSQERVWLGTMDRVHVGLGAGEVEVGEQFVVFRARERVYDPSNDRPLGWHVNVLGWIEVQEVFEEVARAEVRMAFSEMRLGDQILPRELLPHEIELRPTPEGIEGQIVLMANDRFNNGTEDVIFLDRGRNHGLEVGSTLEVYRSVGRVEEPVRRKGLIRGRDSQVRVPARVIGTVVVVTALEESSAAVVKTATTELEIGDRVRSSGIY